MAMIIVLQGADTDGVNTPLVEIDETVALAAAFKIVDVLIVDALAEKDGDGDFPCGDVFQNFRPGLL
jgi:hypothetical protein